MAGFTKKFVKRELIITLKSHNNNFPSVVFTLLRCVYGCLWPACACVCVHIYIYIPSLIPSPSILGVFHSLLSAIGFQSSFFFTADVSPPIRSTLHLLT